MELKYQSFRNFKKILKKLIFKDFFRTRKFEKSVFGDQRTRVEFSKKSRKFANRPRAVGQGVQNHHHWIFLECRCSVRSKWVICQPRTTILEEFIDLWSWTTFDGFSGIPIFDDLRICDFVGKKTKKIKEIIFRTYCISRIVHLGPDVGEFCVLGHILGLRTFCNT